METTPGSLKAGGQAGAETQKLTESSNEFTKYWKAATHSSPLVTSTPVATQQMALPGASTLQDNTSFPQLTSPKKSDSSSLISTPLPSDANEIFVNAFLKIPKRFFPQPNANADIGPTLTPTSNPTRPQKRPRLVEALHKASTPHTESTAHLLEEKGLPRLKPSPLRPDCDPGERLKRWTPINSRITLDEKGLPTNLDEADLQRVKEALDDAYASNTRNVYGTGLFTFHFFCDFKDIPEDHRAPVNRNVLASFIAFLIGTYGGTAIRNYVYGIRAWHVIHGLEWKVNEVEVKTLFEAGNKRAPQESKKKEKEPWTLAYVEEICKALVPSDPIDAAVLACLTTAFWGTARLGEVTVPKLNGFKPTIHVKPSNVKFNQRDRNLLEQTSIFIPWTKAAKNKGEEIVWAKQEGTTDPLAALLNHLEVNKPSSDQHLFSHKHGKTTRPMSCAVFMNRIHKIVADKNLTKLSGHGIRIGSTLEYLLRGVPFDVVKTKGRWKSEAFRAYLRKHAQIMAPYIQANPQAYETLVRYAMPPVR
jgi:hypothetical protein